MLMVVNDDDDGEQSEEDIALKSDLELLVERLKVGILESRRLGLVCADFLCLFQPPPLACIANRWINDTPLDFAISKTAGVGRLPLQASPRVAAHHHPHLDRQHDFSPEAPQVPAAALSRAAGALRQMAC